MSEIIAALNELEKEKNISKEVMIEAIKKSLVVACKSKFDGNESDFEATMDPETGEYTAYHRKTVVEEVVNTLNQISLSEAKAINENYELGDIVKIEICSNEFNRIAAINARNVIVQAIKEGERFALYQKFVVKEKDIITGVVQRFIGNNINVALDDKTDTILTEKEQVPGEVYNIGDRIKLYVVSVTLNNDNNDKDGKDKKDNKNKKDKKDKKGFKIIVSRTHKELVKRLFEKEVAEIADGTVEIMSISREPGSRSKIAVKSNNPDVDPVGACVGHGGNRVNNIVNDLKGEKIDIINWHEDPAYYIKNALSPSDVIFVDVDLDTRSAKVVVPDDQLSLAIGKEGQNVRLAHLLTNYNIDIKSESQARELGMLDDEDEYYED